MKFEIGENRAPKFDAPAWAGNWPVLIDGTEQAEIVETEDGYRLRRAGVWIAPERLIRPTVEDDARNILLPWRCEASHPASDLRYEVAEINGAEYARVTVEGTVTFGPSPGTGRAHEDYQRRYATYTRELEKNA